MLNSGCRDSREDGNLELKESFCGSAPKASRLGAEDFFSTMQLHYTFVLKSKEIKIHCRVSRVILEEFHESVHHSALDDFSAIRRGEAELGDFL